MDESDSRLMSGEEIVFTTRKHWMAPLADSGVAILLLIAAVVLAWLQTDQTSGVMGFVNRVLGLLEIAFVLIGIGWIIFNIVNWRSAEYLVTTMRVLCQEGLVRRRETDSLLSSVSDVRFRATAIGRMLGYGDVQIMTASGQAGEDRFTTVLQAEAFKKKILEQKVAAGEGPRSAAPPAATPTAAAPATASSAPAASPHADTMATLNGLASLRDSGAISAEEYEAKKAELLARI